MNQNNKTGNQHKNTAQNYFQGLSLSKFEQTMDLKQFIRQGLMEQKAPINDQATFLQNVGLINSIKTRKLQQEGELQQNSSGHLEIFLKNPSENNMRQKASQKINRNGLQSSQNNAERQKMKQESLFAKNQILIFSKNLAIFPHNLNSNIPVMPNPQCLGCIQFFYQGVSYDFDATCQKYFILPSSYCQENLLKPYLISLLQNLKQGYIFVSESETKFWQGTRFLGFSQKENAIKLIDKVRELIRKMVYEIGQKYKRLANFQFSILPILENELISDLNEDAVKKHYFGKFVIRIKYNPFIYQFSRVSRSQDHHMKHKAKKLKKTCIKHWPIQCQKSLSFNFLPKISHQNLQFLKEISCETEKGSKYRKATILKLPIKKQDYLISLLSKSLKNNGLQFNIFKPFLKLRNICSLSKSLWVLSHGCFHQTIFKLIGQIMPDDILFTKPQKNLLVVDENFFPSGKFDRFKQKFESLTNSEFIVFNIKQGMRLCQTINSPIYFSFEDIWMSILAMCILFDLSTKRVEFVRKQIILEQINSDTDHPSKNEDKKRHQTEQ